MPEVPALSGIVTKVFASGGVLARERTYAEIAGSTKAVWASPCVTGADHDSQRAFLPLYDVPAMVN